MAEIAKTGNAQTDKETTDALKGKGLEVTETDKTIKVDTKGNNGK